jgi:hypothetical protein
VLCYMLLSAQAKLRRFQAWHDKLSVSTTS